MFPSPVAVREEGKVYRVVTGATQRLVALLMDTLDGEVRLLDGLSLEPRGTLHLGAMRTARACAVAPGDVALAVATPDDVTLYDLPLGAARWKRAVLGDEPALAIAPDGARLAVGAAPQSLQLLGAEDGEPRTDATLRAEPRSVLWDRDGIAVLAGDGLALLSGDGAVSTEVSLGARGETASELVAVGAELLAIAGTSADGAWLELRQRRDGALRETFTLEGDREAEGLCFSGGVLFVSTEGGTYRADKPYDQLVRWLPPLGGAHDPTRLASVADGHVAVAARDVRLFRSRS